MLARIFLLLAATIAASIAPDFAEAADLGPYRPQEPSPAYIPPPASPAEPAFDQTPGFLWTGGYWGLSAGYGSEEPTQSFDRNDSLGLAFADQEGVLGSATLGYNFQLTSGLTVGVEGDVGLMDLSAPDAFGPLWGTIRGRAGVAAGRTLFYGTGGAAFIDVDEVSSGSTLNDDFRSGLVIGAGVEHAFGQHVTVKLEYLYMDFDNFESLSENGEDSSFATEVDLVRAGINYKF